MALLNRRTTEWVGETGDVLTLQEFQPMPYVRLPLGMWQISIVNQLTIIFYGRTLAALSSVTVKSLSLGCMPRFHGALQLGTTMTDVCRSHHWNMEAIMSITASRPSWSITEHFLGVKAVD